MLKPQHPIAEEGVWHYFVGSTKWLDMIKQKGMDLHTFLSNAIIKFLLTHSHHFTTGKNKCNGKAV